MLIPDASSCFPHAIFWHVPFTCRSRRVISLKGCDEIKGLKLLDMQVCVFIEVFKVAF